MITSFLAKALGRNIVNAVVILLAFAALVPALNLLTSPDHALHVPTYMVSLFGKYLTYALLALALDLVWGFCGILSLGHAAFFALGGYAMGIRTPFVDAMTFGLGSGVAGLAGVALSQIDNVSPNLGQGYIIDSFMVVVFGGVGNLWGTLVGALTLGIANKFLEPYAGAVLGKILILVLIILFIQRRPRGLFALKGRAVEQ